MTVNRVVQLDLPQEIEVFCMMFKGGIFEAGFGEKVAFSWPSED